MLRIKRRLIKALQIVSGLLLLGILLFIALQILSRYVLEVSMSWTEESSRFFLVWMVFVGSIVTLSKDENIKLTVLSSRMSGRALHGLLVLVYTVIIIFNVLFALGSYKMARLNWELPALTIPGFSLGFLYIPSGIGAVLIVMISALRIAGSFRKILLGELAEPGKDV